MCDDVAGVGFGGHVMEGDAGFFFAVDERPVERHPAPVLWQQRTVQIDAAGGGDVEQFRLDHVAVVEGEDHIRLHRFDPRRPQRVIDVLRRKDRELLMRGQLRHRAEPEIFVRIVLMRENGLDFDPGMEQFLDADAADVVISEYDSLHFRSPG
ncbi:hypothetical protein SDC9_144374 [bioreactor metagenome]|uniref:Uncharacterized protein n=1 Tax=bioreactor metagenome TaxID=1076179 RepID=A0A645E6L4_9ZZZZ